MLPKDYLLCLRLIAVTEQNPAIILNDGEIIVTRGQADCGGEYIDVALRGEVVLILHLPEHGKLTVPIDLQRRLPPTTTHLMEYLKLAS